MDSSPLSLVTLLADRAGLGLIVVDQALRIQHWNAPLERCNDHVLSQAKGRALAEIFPTADLSELQVRVEQALAPATQAPVKPAGELMLMLGEAARENLASKCQLFSLPAGPATLHFALVFDVPVHDESGVLQATLPGSEQGVIDQGQLIEKLEQANSQLVQSEKLAAIGQLAAGVAHEINNPIGYVSSNLKTLSGYIQDLVRIIDSTDGTQDIEGVQQLKRSLEYDYIRDDVASLIGESEDGLGRVKKIITALKDFSHIDEEEFRLADIHRGIDTTLNVVHSELKYKAEVVKEYGELPEIECIFSQVNQVVMNLLVNAAHAIEEFGLITLRTGRDGEWVWFEVEDTGKGIEPELINRIYEPFFTTKPVGKGTGLGLALSYSIIQKHHGRIKVFSEVGQGTRFRVGLPIKQPLAQDALIEDETRT